MFVSECVVVDICSSAEVNVQGARMNISSPGYPDANEIPISGRSCFCHVRSSSISSNGQVQIMPIDNRHVGCSKITSTRCDRNCWSSLRISSRMFCLSGNSRNFTISSTVPSTSLINITYAALKSVPSYGYTGKFAFSLYGKCTSNYFNLVVSEGYYCEFCALLPCIIVKKFDEKLSSTLEMRFKLIFISELTSRGTWHHIPLAAPVAQLSSEAKPGRLEIVSAATYS